MKELGAPKEIAIFPQHPALSLALPATSFSFSWSWSTASSAMVEAVPGVLPEGSPLQDIRTPPPLLSSPEIDHRDAVVWLASQYSNF